MTAAQRNIIFAKGFLTVFIPGVMLIAFAVFLGHVKQSNALPPSPNVTNAIK